MADEKIERIYTVPLGKAYDYTRTKRTPRAVKLLRQFISQHMKADIETVLLSNKLNSHVWERSIQKPPRKVKVRVIKIADKVKVYLPDEVTDEEKKAQKEKEAKEKAEKLKAEAEKKKKEQEAKKKAEAAAKPKADTEKPKEDKPPKPEETPIVKELKPEKEVSNIPIEQSSMGTGNKVPRRDSPAVKEEEKKEEPKEEKK